MSSYILTPDNKWQIDKDPDDSLMYGVDVHDFLADGDAFTGVPTAVPAEGGGLTVGPALFDTVRGRAVVKARVSGGTVGMVASVTFTWATVGGDIKQQTIYLRIIER
jgi:hypothetical protein